MKGYKKLMCAIICVCAAVLMLFASAGCGTDSVTITYEVDGAAAPPPNTAKAGSAIYPPADPEREGYCFAGWEFNGEPFVFDVMPEEDITLTAVWKKLYTLSFDTGDGATQIPSLECAEGDLVPLPDPPVRAHFRFDGWFFRGETFDPAVMPDEDVTLVAEWTACVTISFVTRLEGVTVPPIAEPAGTPISAPKLKTEGYHLLHWKTVTGEIFQFTVMPEEDITLLAEWAELTNLPALFVDLYDENGAACPLDAVDRNKDAGRDVYTASKISLVNTDGGFEEAAAGFKGRGNGSWTDIPYLKRGYKIKFDKKQSLFGRAANKHWCIIACVSSQFPETTMSRNYLAYNMANELFDGIEYTTAAHWIDVFVNGEYRGVYLLCEHVRVGEGRVDIPSDYLHAEQDPASTGYLIEYDAYAQGNENEDYFRIDGVKYPFTLHSPDPEDDGYLTDGGISLAEFQKQVAYIKDYVARVYDAALSGDFITFSTLADVDSFTDMYLLHELFKNVDAGYSSFYLYKKPNGKLFAGPAWDFDGTCNATRGDQSPSGIYVAGSVQTSSPETASELFIALYRQTEFQSKIRARWKVLSPKIRAFLDVRLNDSVYLENRAAMGKNYAKWLDLPQSEAESNWVSDTKALKQWLLGRILWLDGEWK